ncbi:hypothetical protein [Streptomyces sp. NPDC001658]
MNQNHIPELGRVMRVIGEHGENLSRDTASDKLAEMRDDLQKALKLLEEVAGPKPLTRCKTHPFGAVDKEAPDLCLLCQTRRRRAEEQRKRDAGWVRPAY